jgi:hypothetical protein
MFFASVGLLAPLALKSRLRLTAVEVLVLIVFGYLAWSSVRAIVWWGLVIAPILARLAGGVLMAHLPVRRDRPLVNGLILAGVIAVAAFSLPWTKTAIPILPAEKRGLLSDDTPVRVGDYLRTHDPPTSGCHYSLGSGTAPISPGVYDKHVDPEYWVHNLEHGYIVVSYNCPTGCSSELQSLSTWYHALPRDPGGGVAYAKFIAVPYAAQKEKWDIESWDWFDPMGSTLRLAEVQTFYANHVNQAPEGATSG